MAKKKKEGLEDLKILETGRPFKKEQREDLTAVGFKADAETIEAINYFVQKMNKNAISGISVKSAAIRYALVKLWKLETSAE